MTNRLRCKLILVFILLCFCGKAEDFKMIRIVDHILNQCERIEKFNHANEVAGQSYKNQYLIFVDTVWIEERPTGSSLDNVSYDYLNRILQNFNKMRHDSLRFYVVVVSNYEVQLKQALDIARIRFKFGKPDIRQAFDGLADSITLEQVHQKLRSDVTRIPSDISKLLQARNFNARVIYFYGAINFFVSKNQRQFLSFDNLLVEGTIANHKDKIKEIARAGRGDEGYRPVQLHGAGFQIYDAMKAIMKAIRLSVDGTNLLLPDMHVTPSDKRGVWINPDTLTAPKQDPNNANNLLYESGNLYTLLNGQKTPYTNTASGFLKDVLLALNSIRSTPDGGAMLNALSQSPYSVIIYHTSFNDHSTNKQWSKYYPSDADAANVISHYDQGIFNTQTLGSGGKVFWYQRNVGYPPNSVLAHELFHAWDGQRGYLDNRKSFSASYPVDEARAVYFQDKMHKHLGLPLIENFSQEIPPPVIRWLKN